LPTFVFFFSCFFSGFT